MREPNFDSLRKEIEKGEKRSSGYATGVHPNPYYWKYFWWVFHEGAACDGWAFLEPEHRLPIGIAWPLINEIKASGRICWIYNQRLPRRDPLRTPFDPEHPRWNAFEWATAFDDDPDPLYEGFK